MPVPIPAPIPVPTPAPTYHPKNGVAVVGYENDPAGNAQGLLWDFSPRSINGNRGSLVQTTPPFVTAHCKSGGLIRRRVSLREEIKTP